jgi:hypothetical protein
VQSMGHSTLCTRRTAFSSRDGVRPIPLFVSSFAQNRSQCTTQAFLLPVPCSYSSSLLPPPSSAPDRAIQPFLSRFFRSPFLFFLFLPTVYGLAIPKYPVGSSARAGYGAEEPGRALGCSFIQRRRCSSTARESCHIALLLRHDSPQSPLARRFSSALPASLLSLLSKIAFRGLPSFPSLPPSHHSTNGCFLVSRCRRCHAESPSCRSCFSAQCRSVPRSAPSFLAPN